MSTLELGRPIPDSAIARPESRFRNLRLGESLADASVDPGNEAPRGLGILDAILSEGLRQGHLVDVDAIDQRAVGNTRTIARLTQFGWLNPIAPKISSIPAYDGCRTHRNRPVLCTVWVA
jgi:hypothetical protein